MSGRNKGSKAKIHMSKPELPPFLQRMKEQIVANEDAQRKEQSQRKRKDRPGRPDDPDDDPTIVKIGDDDLTEEEYKRMKTELETQYKLDNDRTNSKPIELDVDDLIQNRLGSKVEKTHSKSKPAESVRSHKPTIPGGQSSAKDVTERDVRSNNKQLSYGSSSDEDET